MPSITKLVIKSYSLEYLDVSWETADEPFDPADYRYRVKRSESPEGPFEYVSRLLTDVYAFRDRSVNLESKWRDFYYQIEVTKPGDPSFVHLSPVNHLANPPDLVGLELHRLQELHLKVNVGRPVVVLKHRTFGPPCPDCFDSKFRQRKERSDCQTCFSSRYRGGFFSPITVYADGAPPPKVIRMASFFELTPSEKVFDMAGYPLVRERDVIVEDTNRRWRVQDVRPMSKKQFIYQQLVRAMEIPRTDNFYKFPITESMFEITESIETFRPDHTPPIGRTGRVLDADALGDPDPEL